MDGRCPANSPNAPARLSTAAAPLLADGCCILAALLALLGCCWMSVASFAAEPAACKICRDYHQACVKAHSPGACKSEFDICMKHCRQK